MEFVARLKEGKLSEGKLLETKLLETKLSEATPPVGKPTSPPSVRAILNASGLRPTRQRLALASLLFAKGNRHVSAEMLHEEAIAKRVPVSLATVYNTLHQFTGAGLLREVAVDASRTYFDTNICDHQHFFIEDEGRVMDISGGKVGIDQMPEIPDGMEISRVDIVIRLRRIR